MILQFQKTKAVLTCWEVLFAAACKGKEILTDQEWTDDIKVLKFLERDDGEL